MKNKTLKIVNILMPILSVILIIVMWAISAYVIDVDMVLPSVGDTLQELGRLLVNKDTYLAIGTTLLRSLIAFLLAFVFGTGLAVLSSMYKPVKAFLSPLIVLFRAIPTMAVILLILVWVTSMEAPIIVSFVVIFPLIYGGYLSAIEGIDKNLIEMCKVYKVPLSKRIISLYIPQTSIGLLDIVQNTIGFNVKIIIAAEVIGVTKDSIGIAMHTSQLYLEIATLIAWTIIAIILSGLLEFIVWIGKCQYIRSRL